MNHPIYRLQAISSPTQLPTGNRIQQKNREELELSAKNGEVNDYHQAIAMKVYVNAITI